MPKYMEIADVLRKRIKDGTYPKDSLLPYQTELVEEFGVSRMTIKNAVNKAKIDTVIIAGNNAANERETAGGTPSGMLMTKRGLPARRRKISVEMIDTINAKNNP